MLRIELKQLVKLISTLIKQTSQIFTEDLLLLCDL